MRRLSALALVATLSASPALADGPVGVWQSEKNDEGRWIEVTVGHCGSQICGTISEVHGTTDRSKVGMQMIRAMVPDGPNAWDDGEIFAPDDEKWYDSNMKMLSNTQLEVSGCVAFGLICRSQIWTRLR